MFVLFSVLLQHVNLSVLHNLQFVFWATSINSCSLVESLLLVSRTQTATRVRVVLSSDMTYFSVCILWSSTWVERCTYCGHFWVKVTILRITLSSFYVFRLLFFLTLCLWNILIFNSCAHFWSHLYFTSMVFLILCQFCSLNDIICTTTLTWQLPSVRPHAF